MAESEMYAVNGDLSIPKPKGVSEVYIVNGDTSVARPSGVSPVYAVNGDTSIPNQSGVSPIYVGNIESEVACPAGVSSVRIGNFSVTPPEPPEPPEPDIWLKFSISAGGSQQAYIQKIGQILLSDSPEGYSAYDLTDCGATDENYPLSYKMASGSTNHTSMSSSEKAALMGGTTVNTSTAAFILTVKLPKGKKPKIVSFLYAFKQYNNVKLYFSVAKGTVENGSFVSGGTIGSSSLTPKGGTSAIYETFALTWPS